MYSMHKRCNQSDMMAKLMPKMAPDTGSQESNCFGQRMNKLGHILMVVTAVNVVLSLSTLILLAVVTSQVGRYANHTPIIATDVTKTALLEVTSDRLLMKNIMSKFVDSLVSQENIDELMAKIPFILGDPDVNLPAQLAQAVATELPFMIDYAYKAVNHSIDAIEYVKADIVELENADIEAWFTTTMNNLHMGLKDIQEVMAVVDETFSDDAAPDVQRLHDIKKISGIWGAAMSMLGLLPDTGSENNEVIFPLLKWHQSQIDGPKIAPLFEACDKLLDDVLDGPERLLHPVKFMLNKTSDANGPAAYDDYADYDEDEEGFWAWMEAGTETCEYQVYDHMSGDSSMFGINAPPNCTSHEVADFSWEDSTSTITSSMMCECTWSASVQGYLKNAVGYYGNDEAFRTELMGVKDACSKMASTLYRLSSLNNTY